MGREAAGGSQQTQWTAIAHQVMTTGVQIKGHDKCINIVDQYCTPR